MARRPFAPLVVLALAGCLEAGGSYLSPDWDVSMPRTLAVTDGEDNPEAAWAREQPLGLEGSVAATLVHPGLGRVLLARDARARRAGDDGPDAAARQTWTRWYQQGRTLPIQVRWRFARNFHAESITDPSSWALALVADDGGEIRPLRTGRVVREDDDSAWVGTFTAWFPWRDASGRPAFGRGTRRLRLSIQGTPGRAELQWRFAPLLTDGRHAAWGLDP